jgi:hypothetical protein
LLASRGSPNSQFQVAPASKADMNRQARPAGSVENDAVDGACSAASKCHRLVASKPERFKEVRPGNDDGVPKFWRNWRGHDDVMQTRSIRGSGEPVWVIALIKCALTIGTRSAQSIMASGFTAAQTGRTHDRTRPMLHKRQKVLAKAAPSTHDPKQASPMSGSRFLAPLIAEKRRRIAGDRRAMAEPGSIE